MTADQPTKQPSERPTSDMSSHKEVFGSATSLQPGLSVCWSVGRSVGRNLLKGWVVTLQCSYRSTCSSISRPIWQLIKSGANERMLIFLCNKWIFRGIKSIILHFNAVKLFVNSDMTCSHWSCPKLSLYALLSCSDSSGQVRFISRGVKEDFVKGVVVLKRSRWKIYSKQLKKVEDDRKLRQNPRRTLNHVKTIQ